MPPLSPTSVCEQLSALGDAPAATYLDLLFSAYIPFDQPHEQESPLIRQTAEAARAVFDHVPLEDLCARFLREYRRLDLHDVVLEVVTYCIEQASFQDPIATVGVIIDIARATPVRSKSIVTQLSRGIHDEALMACICDDVLGRLDARDYAALVGRTIDSLLLNHEVDSFSRVDYLAARVTAHASIDLSVPARDVARAILPEWRGTLDELLDTARSLSLGLPDNQNVRVA
jgi:hypothetical protein